MNKQNFTAHNPFPLSIESLDFMQDMITMVQELSRIGGKNYILSGCEKTDTNKVDKGYLVIDGEILPFEGGTVNTTVTIIEDVKKVTVENVDFNNVRVERRAEFSSTTGTGYHEWSKFEHLPTNLELAEKKADITYVNDEIAKHQGSTIPKGVIVMWSGTTAPTGWAICDSRIVDGFTTPDLRGKFIVGYNASDLDFNSIGARTNGEKAVKLEEQHLPKHRHDFKDYYHAEQYDGGASGSTYIGRKVHGSGDTDTDNTYLYYYNNKTDTIGLDKAHNNLPPYYVLAYIIKL